MLQDQEQAKTQAYSQKLLQDCATSLILGEQNRKVHKLNIRIIIMET